MALRVRGDQFEIETGIAVGEIGRSSALVSRLTGYAVQRNKAIVGANAFAHEAGIHQDGVLKDVSTYQIMDPERARPDDDAAARQALGAPRLRARVRRGRDRARARGAEPRVQTLQGAGRLSAGGHPSGGLRRSEVR